MSFSPLPTSFSEHLSALDPTVHTVVEIGSGEGALSAQIAALAGRCLRLEKRHPASGLDCDVVGDARCAPVRDASVAVVVAANLVRHLSPIGNLGAWVAHWRRLLIPDGFLYIFEDDPDSRVPSQRNFRDLQRFLARLLPESRGPLLSLGRFRRLVAAEPETQEWAFGHQANRETIDTAAVLRLLDAGQGKLTGTEAALSEAIVRDGVAPGRYWWACAGPVNSEASE